MATKKKTKKIINDPLSVGDEIVVIDATIFDSDGNLSDRLMTGVVTKLNPEPGWDYEVEYHGALALSGREEISSRFYNKHQIARNVKSKTIKKSVSPSLVDLIRDEDNAVRGYDRTVDSIEYIEKRIREIKKPEDACELYAHRNELLESLPKYEKNIEKARSALADRLNELLSFSNNQTTI